MPSFFDRGVPEYPAIMLETDFTVLPVSETVNESQGCKGNFGVSDPLRSRLNRRSRCPPHEGDTKSDKIGESYSPPREGESRRRRQGVAHTEFSLALLRFIYRFYDRRP